MNVNATSRPDVIRLRAKALSDVRNTFAAHPGHAYQFAQRLGIPRSFITLYLTGQRAGVRGKAKLWAVLIQKEADALRKRAAELGREQKGYGKPRKG